LTSIVLSLTREPHQGVRERGGSPAFPKRPPDWQASSAQLPALYDVKDYPPSQSHVSLWDIEKLKTGLNPNPTRLNIDIPNLALTTPSPSSSSPRSLFSPRTSTLTNSTNGLSDTSQSPTPSQSFSSVATPQFFGSEFSNDAIRQPTLQSSYSNTTLDTVHPDDPNTPDFASPGQYMCSTCRKHFPKRHLLNKHRRTSHDKPYKCPVLVCPFRMTGFGKRNDLERHKKSTHSEHFQTSSYLCPHMNCQLSVTGFSRHDNCKRHIEQQHPEVPYLPPRISTLPPMGVEA
ncbi:uncharacterized protein PAC_17204, partial [Phialocephala subalpina]